ncbi:proline-serine-threonine phosphatase-interacting 1 isoform X2, partial [Paramuricea clavata]
KTVSSNYGETYRVKYNYTANNADEVTVHAGDIITVIESAKDGWSTIITNDKRGQVPTTYVEKYESGKVPAKTCGKPPIPLTKPVVITEKKPSAVQRPTKLPPCPRQNP